MDTWMNSDYFIDDCDYLDEDLWCTCNCSVPLLYRLILEFSYLYETCRECNPDYTTDETIDYKEILMQIKNIIRKNPNVLTTKMMDMTPMDFINRLDKILDKEDTHPFLKYREHAQIRANQHSLYTIKKFIIIEYPQEQLEKKFAFRYIKNSNHIGNDETLLQLPLEMWEYIFTFP